MGNSQNSEDVGSDAILSSDFIFAAKEETNCGSNILGSNHMQYKYKKEDTVKLKDESIGKINSFKFYLCMLDKQFLSKKDHKMQTTSVDHEIDVDENVSNEYSPNFSSSFLGSPIKESNPIFYPDDSDTKNEKDPLEINKIVNSIIEKQNNDFWNTPADTQIKNTFFDPFKLQNNMNLNDPLSKKFAKDGIEAIKFKNCNASEKNVERDIAIRIKNKRRSSILDIKPFHWAFNNENDTMKKAFSAPINQKQRENINNKYWNNCDSGVRHTLDHIGTGKCDSYIRIEPQCLEQLISDDRKDFLLIDCRFAYEFNGGHIKTAVNISSQTEIEKLYFKYSSELNSKENIEISDSDNRIPEIIIFHCEFSSVRAPRMAKYFRTLDRGNNVYPNLTFPEIYILEGGYKRFYREFNSLCDPMSYVTMDAKEFQEECKNEHKKLRRQK